MPTHNTKAFNLLRFHENPLLSPQDIKPSFPNWEVLGVFNAGVVQVKDETIMLLRIAERPMSDEGELLVPIVQPDVGLTSLKLDHTNDGDYSDPRVVRDQNGRVRYLTSLSHFRVARSGDGIHFDVDHDHVIWPEGPLEAWGIEDPRITPMEDQFHITYSAVSDKGVAVGHMVTTDFRTFRREGSSCHQRIKMSSSFLSVSKDGIICFIVLCQRRSVCRKFGLLNQRI